MNVLLCALECWPFIKVGGVADVVAGLAGALAERGHKVTVALPRCPLPSVGGVPQSFEVVGLGVTGFDRDDPYGHEVDRTGEGANRLAKLAWSILAMCRERVGSGDPFQIVHVHDWPLGMVPYLLRHVAADLSSTRHVLTVHNAAFHGLFPPFALGAYGLGPDHASRLLAPDGFLSTLVGGIGAAHAVTTVSPTYANQMATPEFGLDHPLRTRVDPAVGILNGIDMDSWNPSTDQTLSARYDPGDLSGRAICKRGLLAEVGLEVDLSRPLVLFAGRIYLEKGIDVLTEALPSMTRMGVQVAVAGKGDAELEHNLLVGSGDGVSCIGYAPEPLMRRLLSAADIVLVPSRREACGLVQLYAQRYGALPVAHRTGGLVDTVTDPETCLDQATGFLFDPLSVDALLGALGRALVVMDSPHWTAMQRRAMCLDRSWGSAGASYEELYVGLMGGRGHGSD